MAMRRLAFFTFFVVLASANLSASSVHIQEIGLQGYFSYEPMPTRVRLLVQNSELTAQTIELHFRVRDLERRAVPYENRFTLRLVLGPREERSVEVPLLFFPASKPILEVEARSAQGKLLGMDQRPPELPVGGPPDTLVAILCVEQADCQSVQSAIMFSGTPDERSLKGKALKFVSLPSPESHWWSYAQAEVVVVASAAERFMPDQFAALEEYARQGGRLVLVEDRIGNPAFLRAYRKGPPTPNRIVLGKGTLYRLSTASPDRFAGVLGGKVLRSLASWASIETMEFSWVRKRLATSFHFPSLGWLLIWLGIYIAVVGALNFAVLQRLGKREWGWITVPALAILFAVALYALSAADRPRSFGADELAVYWMDDRSSLVAAMTGVRVSSPQRATVGVTVPGDVVFTGEAGQNQRFGLAVAMQANSVEGGWKATVGPPWRTQLPLLQWSFQDLGFRGMKTFPGTVRRSAPMRLRNETGQSFQAAIFVQRDTVYFLGPMQPGAEADLATVRKEPLNSQVDRSWGGLFTYPNTLDAQDPGERMDAVRISRNAGDPKEQQAKMEEWRHLPKQPFALVELIRGWPRDGGYVFEGRSGVFFGLSEENVLGSSLDRVPFVRKARAVTVVSFAPQP